MAWFAQGVSIPQYSRTGVVDYPYENGTNIYVLQTGLDDALGTSYYIVADGNGSSDAAAESSFFGNATYDIGHDGRPMIFLVNAPQLPEWSRFSGNINHYVTGYEYSYWSDENNSAHNLIYYADSASTSDGVTAGDYSVTYDTMWSAEKNSDGYWVDQSGYHSLLVV